jgi:putative transposase
VILELDEHLGYEKHSPEGKNTGNSRNGYTPKKLKGNFGEIDIITLVIAIAALSRKLLVKVKRELLTLINKFLRCTPKV